MDLSERVRAARCARCCAELRGVRLKTYVIIFSSRQSNIYKHGLNTGED